VNCRYCGSELPEGALFCGECGRAVMVQAPVEAAPAPVVVEQAPFIALQPQAPDLSQAPPPVAGTMQVGPMPVAFSAADAASEDPADHIPDPHPAPTCPQCGTAVEDDEIFCGECGFVLRTVPPPVLEGPPPLDDVPVDPVPGEAPLFPAASIPEPPRLTDMTAADVGAADLSVADPVAPDMSATDIVPPLEPDLELSLDRVPRPDPFPWGAQRAVVPEDIEDIEATRLSVDPLAGERFVLQFSTGENVTVTGAGLVGRNPVAQPGEFVDQLVSVFDPSKSISKTHLEFGQESGRFWVSDRFSTNGSVVRQPDADPKRCDPGKRYFIARGSRVDVGEQFFVVS
jgi:predicted nucleic acid-binding Zn ribbon protein